MKITPLEKMLPSGTAILVPILKNLYGLCRIVLIKRIPGFFTDPENNHYLVATSPWVGREKELNLSSSEARALHEGPKHLWTWVYPIPLPSGFKIAGTIEPTQEEISIDTKKLSVPLEGGAAMLSWDNLQRNIKKSVYDNFKTHLAMKEREAESKAKGFLLINNLNPQMLMGGYSKHGRPGGSGYTITNGVVHWNGASMLAVDAKTFVPFTPEWGMDKHHVWMQNSVRKSIDRASFRLLNPLFGVDRRGVYLCYRELVGADAKTFQALDSGVSYYGSYMDDYLVRPRLIGYAKDKKSVYFCKHEWDSLIEIRGADLGSFRSLHNGFALDQKYVYAHGRRIPKANPRTWRMIAGEYSMDDQRVFNDRDELYQIDRDIFRTIKIDFSNMATDGKLMLWNTERTARAEWLHRIEEDVDDQISCYERQFGVRRKK